MRACTIGLLLSTGCILRGGAIATYRPGHGAGVEATATGALGQKGATGNGAALGVTLDGGYDPLGAAAGGGGASLEYFSPYVDSSNRWMISSLLTCGARFIDKHVANSILGAVSCELRVGPMYLLDDSGGQQAKWGGVDLLVRYAFAGDAAAEGWTLGLAGTFDQWFTLSRVRN